MRSGTRVLVTGGTGHTGGRIAARLAELGLGVRTASRAAAAAGPGEHVRFDWADPSTHAAALAGVTRMYLVAPAMVEAPELMMLPFIERALAGGVRRVVVLSSSAIAAGDPGIGLVDRAVRALAPEWAVLQPSWFMQNLIEGGHFHGKTLLEDGVVTTSTGSGRIGFVDADDIAEVGVRALADDVSHDAAHVITGPQALSYDDVAEMIGQVLGRVMRHVKVDDAEAQRRLVAGGMPLKYAQLLVGLDAAIRGGAEDRVTDTVERVTGRPPRGFAAFVRAHLGGGGVTG